jgi:hypothetical protein
MAWGSVFRVEFALRFVRPTFAKAFGSCRRFLSIGEFCFRNSIRGPLWMAFRGHHAIWQCCHFLSLFFFSCFKVTEAK